MTCEMYFTPSHRSKNAICSNRIRKKASIVASGADIARVTESTGPMKLKMVNSMKVVDQLARVVQDGFFHSVGVSCIKVYSLFIFICQIGTARSYSMAYFDSKQNYMVRV